MGETRKLAAILVADVVGYNRLAYADEDSTLSRLRGLPRRASRLSFQHRTRGCLRFRLQAVENINQCCGWVRMLMHDFSPPRLPYDGCS
jgi:hypothetical protein